MNLKRQIVLSILALALFCLASIQGSSAKPAYKAKTENISQTPTASVFPSIAVDAWNNPHIVWIENTPVESNICYQKWNGSGWVDISGKAVNYSNSKIFSCETEDAWPKIRIATDGFPAIVWEYRKGQSHYAKWNGFEWRNIRGEAYSVTNGSINNGSFDLVATEFEFGSDGFPRIMNYNKFLKFEQFRWVTVRGQPFTGNNDEMHAMNGYQVAFELDSSDRPHICWTSFFAAADNKGNPYTATRVSYAKWTGEDWVTLSGDPLDGTNATLDVVPETMTLGMALDSKGQPTVAMSVAKLDYQLFEIYVRSGANGAWKDREIIRHPAKSSSVRPDIAIDDSDTVHLAWVEYSHNTNSVLKIFYAFKRGGSWITADGTRFRGVDGITGFEYDGDGSLLPRMAVDSKGNPHLAWHDRSMAQAGFKPPEVLYATVSTSSIGTVKTTVEFAIDSLTVFIDGNPEVLTGAPYIFNGSMMVPFRFLGEALGASLNYTVDPKTKLVKTITYELEGKLITLEIGSTVAVSGEEAVHLTIPPQIRKGKTYVPLRFVIDAMGGAVEWSTRFKKATITYPK